jgi:hypothetical protein
LNGPFFDPLGLKTAAAEVGIHEVLNFNHHRIPSVAGFARAYKATSWLEDVQAFGSLHLAFEPSQAMIAGDQIDFIFGVDAPVATPDAGIDIFYSIYHYRPAGGVGGAPIFVPLTNAAGIRLENVRKPVPTGRNFLHTESVDVSGLSWEGWDPFDFFSNDKLVVKFTSRVWANSPGGPAGRGAPVNPTLPEPATWLLGLTGLAAVVGTQAWKKRYPKSAV